MERSALRRKAITVFLVVVAVALPSSAAAQVRRYGIVAAWNEQLELDSVRTLGTGSGRIGLYWAISEPSPGQFDWGPLDLHLDFIVGQLGLSAYVNLGEQTPAWAGPCPQCEPYNDNDFGDFVEQAIRHAYARYPDADIVFGIWNEPNLDSFLHDTSDGQVYGRLFQAASLARDRVSPNVRLGAPETSHHALLSSNYFNSVMSRIEPYLHSGDMVTVHWYPDGGNLAGYMNTVSLRSGGREVWLTETGQGTCNDSAQENTLNNIITTFDNSSSNWKRVFIYALRSGSSCDASIVRGDWSPRPAYLRYQNLIANSHSAAFVDQGVPATMGPGQQYNVWVRMRNTGSSIWSAPYGFRLGSQNPENNTRWGLYRVDVPSLTSPGQEVTFNFTVTAPTTPGNYNFQWRMLRELIRWFGDYTPNVVVRVAGGSTYTIDVQCSNQQWVSAENGGGGAVNCNRDSVSYWETFYLFDPSGGQLASGHAVYIQTADQIHFFTAFGGGGDGLTATAPQPLSWETFYIEKDGGGPIYNLDTVWFRTVDGSHFWTAEGGGGGVLNANRTEVQSWERFKITIQ